MSTKSEKQPESSSQPSLKQPDKTTPEQAKKGKAPKRTQQLSPQQRLFITLYSDPKSETFGNAYQSAVKAGYSEEYAKRIIAPTSCSENIRTAMHQALEDAGLTDAELASKHKELLNKREVVFVQRGKDWHHELSDQPDTQAVKAGLDMAYKIKKHYPVQGVQLQGDDGQPVELVFISAKEAKKLTPKERAKLKQPNE